MKKLLLLLCVLCAAQPELRAQGGRGYLYQEWTVEQGDSTPLIHVAPVPVFQRPADRSEEHTSELQSPWN